MNSYADRAGGAAVSGPCTVWHIYQARCTLCNWAAEVTSVASYAAQEARDHRASAEHQARLKE